MHDNGLLGYYKSLQNKDGYLDLTASESFKLGRKVKYHSLVAKMQAPEGLFYIKESDPLKSSAEIVLSQIYKTSGFDAAIYLPAIFGKNNTEGVVSNNIETKNSILAYDFFKRNNIKFYNTPLQYYLSNSEQAKFFSEDLIKQLIELRVFDYSSFNFDRHKLNFCFNVQNRQAQNVVLFDNGASALGYLKYDIDSFPFNNDFSITPMDKPEFLEQLKNLAQKTNLINLNDLANKVGSVDVDMHVRDIKDSINFTVDKDYAYALSNSFENMANELIQG